MSTRGWIAAAVLFPAAALGGSVVIDPPRPWQGDPVRILIELDPPARPGTRPSIEADNLAAMRVDLDFSRRPQVLRIEGFAIAGEIVIHSGEYHSQSKLRERIPVVRVPVVPLPIEPGDPIRSFDALRRVGTSPVLFQAVAPERKPIAGERVRIEWRAIWPPDTRAGNFRLASTTRNVWVRKVEGAGEVRLQQGERRDRSIALGGNPVMAQTLYWTSFVAPAPGMYMVPPIDFVGRDRGSQPETFLRESPPMTVEVAAAPPAAQGLAIGDFRLRCRAYGLDLWPTVVVGIEGMGNLARGTGPRLEAKTPFAVVIRRIEPSIDEFGRPRASAIFSAHARGDELQLPDIVLPYFDPEQGRRAEARCTPPKIGWPRRPSPPAAESTVAPATWTALGTPQAERGGIALLVIALVIAGLAFRR